VRARADQLLSDFPGLHAEARVLGVGYDGLRPADAVSSRPRLSLALPRTAAVRPPAHDSASWTNQIRQAERFVGQLRFGKPIEAREATSVATLVGDIAAGKPTTWAAAPAPFFYFVLRADAVDIAYGTRAGFERLGVPYMAHIEPAGDWS
jgi:hypothetical protein